MKACCEATVASSEKREACQEATKACLDEIGAIKNT
jgi:hypothetical protein